MGNPSILDGRDSRTRAVAAHAGRGWRSAVHPREGCRICCRSVSVRDAQREIGGDSGAAASLLACALALSGCSGSSVGTGSGSGGGSGTGTGAGSPTPSASGSPTSTPQSITGDWRLVSGTGASGPITPSATPVTLKINGQGSGGSGGCNAFGAIASASTTGAFTIRLGIHTDMACVGAGRDITEQHYFAALARITTASMQNGELVLSGPGVSLTFARPGAWGRS